MVLWSVIDFETTGKNKIRKDYAVSLGTLIADINDEKGTIKCIDSFYSLINIPNPLMTEDTKHIHGICVEDVAKAPTPSDVCSEFLRLNRQYKFKHAAAWYYAFDKGFFDRLFIQADMRVPSLNWKELQPVMYARLDEYSPNLKCELVKELPGHHALKDCARALCVYAENNGYDFDTPSLINELNACGVK
jgi:DNA polymerase III epsilon subunit-like protein